MIDKERINSQLSLSCEKVITSVHEKAITSVDPGVVHEKAIASMCEKSTTSACEKAITSIDPLVGADQ